VKVKVQYKIALKIENSVAHFPTQTDFQVQKLIWFEKSFFPVMQIT